MQNQLMFEGQEVKVTTENGQTLINLVATAKACGLVRARENNQVIRWDDVKKKLNSICSSVESSTPQVVNEIRYALDEIENSDDRNSIFISTWLAKRLAVECHSDKAMRYKNFLVSLDEKRETAVQAYGGVDPAMFLQLAQGVQSIGFVVQSMQTAMVNIEMYVKDSIMSKDIQIEEAMNLIGIRSRNVKSLSEHLKDKVSEITGTKITGISREYNKYKQIVFKYFKVDKWEDIPVREYNHVHAYIDELE